MAWYSGLLRAFTAAPVKKARRESRRDYAAAASSRLTLDWARGGNTSANADLYRALDTLRARSRSLCNDNPYAKRFLGMVSANVVGGPGVILQARVYNSPGKPDTGANDAIEAAWADWSRRGICDVTGRLSWRDMQNLVIRTVARDGEALIRRIRGSAAGNAYGYALQVLDIDRLDTRLIRAPENGRNEIRMGVEIDSYGRAVAYWLRPYHPGDQWHLAQAQVTADHQRIPADEILHVYTADRPEALRGVPWLHAAMIQLQNLGGYEEAAVIAARVGASKMGFFTSPDGQPAADGEDADGVPYTEAEPGAFGVLPEGMQFQNFNPDYPHAMYAQFVSAALRGVSSGLGVAYHAMANDLEGVNFSSIRAGTLEERDQWIGIQAWFIDAFIEPVYQDWLTHALAFGQVLLGNGSPLPVEKRDKFAAHTWQPRRWQWVDPLKDMEASVLAIQHGLKAPQDIAAELGVDYEDVLVKIRQAQDLAAKIGVQIGAAPAATPAPAPQEPDPALKALAEVARSLASRAPDQPPAPAPVHVSSPVSVSVGLDEFLAQVRQDSRAEPIVIPAPIVHVAAPEVHVAAPEVHVAAPEVRIENTIEPTPVTLEATIQPAEVKVELPPRRSDTSIVYNAAGDIVAATQIERDA